MLPAPWSLLGRRRVGLRLAIPSSSFQPSVSSVVTCVSAEWSPFRLSPFSTDLGLIWVRSWSLFGQPSVLQLPIFPRLLSRLLWDLWLVRGRSYPLRYQNDGSVDVVSIATCGCGDDTLVEI